MAAAIYSGLQAISLECSFFALDEIDILSCNGLEATRGGAAGDVAYLLKPFPAKQMIDAIPRNCLCSVH
jgi:hypothetical protein